VTSVKRRNVTVRSKDSLNLVVSHISGQVLDKNVVESLPLVSAALRVEFDTDKVLLVGGCFKSFFGVLGVLKANESVATRGVLFIERNLAGDYASELLEVILQVFGLHVLVNLSDKDILFLQLWKIDSKQVRAVGERTALFRLEEEVAEVLFDSFKLVWVVNSDDSGVEGFVDVSSDLWLLYINATLLLDESGELG
jgi:hypothetical protein